MTCSGSIIRFSHRHEYSDNCICLIEWHSRTMAVISLSCACKRTVCESYKCRERGQFNRGDSIRGKKVSVSIGKPEARIKALLSWKFTVWQLKLKGSFTHHIREIWWLIMSLATYTRIKIPQLHMEKITVVLSVLLFCPKKSCLSPAADQGSSCSWMAVMMWRDSEQNPFAHHVFVTIHYCVVVVTVSRN